MCVNGDKTPHVYMKNSHVDSAWVIQPLILPSPPNCGLRGLLLHNQAPGKGWFVSLQKWHLVWGIPASSFRVWVRAQAKGQVPHPLCWARERSSKGDSGKAGRIHVTALKMNVLWGERNCQICRTWDEVFLSYQRVCASISLAWLLVLICS